MHAPPRPPTALVALFVLSCLPGRADAAESYDGCSAFIDAVPAVVTSPGYYCLRSDLATSQATGNAIEILADDVTIDCNDFKLGGLGAGVTTGASGITAYAGRTDVTIRRCNVRGFRVGLYLYAHNALVEDNRLDGNTYVGILSQGNRARIRRNYVVDTGGTTTVANYSMPSAIYFGSESDISANSVVGVRTTLANGLPFGIQGRDSWEGTPVLGSISGNRVAGVEAPAEGGAVAISAGLASAVITDNTIIGGGTAADTGILCHDPFDASVARNNTLTGYTINALACIDGGGNVSL